MLLAWIIGILWREATIARQGGDRPSLLHFLWFADLVRPVKVTFQSFFTLCGWWTSRHLSRILKNIRNLVLCFQQS